MDHFICVESKPRLPGVNGCAPLHGGYIRTEAVSVDSHQKCLQTSMVLMGRCVKRTVVGVRVIGERLIINLAPMLQVNIRLIDGDFHLKSSELPSIQTYNKMIEAELSTRPSWCSILIRLHSGKERIHGGPGERDFGKSTWEH